MSRGIHSFIAYDHAEPRETQCLVCMIPQSVHVIIKY